MAILYLLSQKKLDESRRNIEQYIHDNAALSATLEVERSFNEKARVEQRAVTQELEQSKALRFELEKQLELQLQQHTELEKRQKDFDRASAEAMVQAKAAIFEISGTLSSKLMEEHLRENQSLKQAQEEKVKQTTEQLHVQFQNILNMVATLSSRVRESNDTVELVKRALLSPTGAGSLAEITLENILKASGLTLGVDFIMQYTVSSEGGDKLRPDAIVFLPDDNVMIIDSKASKFFLEMAVADSEVDERNLEAKLKNSMRGHLKMLASKDYKEAVRTHLSKIKSNIKYISTLMFLPSDIGLEKLMVADFDFIQKAYQLDIIPSGPTGIVNILAHARYMISEHKQEENHQLIIEEVRKLLGSIGIIYDHARKLGSSIQSSAAHFDKFAGSFNSNLLSKAKTIEKLGVNPKANKNLPGNLERYQLISHDLHLIEVEEETPLAQIENSDDK
jgi:DNA recombination protein RmuC